MIFSRPGFAFKCFVVGRVLCLLDSPALAATFPEAPIGISCASESTIINTNEWEGPVSEHVLVIFFNKQGRAHHWDDSVAKSFYSRRISNQDSGGGAETMIFEDVGYVNRLGLLVGEKSGEIVLVTEKMRWQTPADPIQSTIMILKTPQSQGETVKVKCRLFGDLPNSLQRYLYIGEK